MEFTKLVDYGGTQEVTVDGLGGIELVTPNILRCRYYTCHEFNGDGGREKRLAISLRWDRARFLNTWAMLASMGPIKLVDALPVLDGSAFDMLRLMN